MPPSTFDRVNTKMQLESLLKGLPSSIDTETILGGWKLASRWFDFGEHYFPKPVWAQREFEHTGNQAWANLRRQITGKQSSEALSVYVHVPFCERRCGFCDLYSIPMPQANRFLEDDFSRALLREIDTWSRCNTLYKKPVTTVHFGGGTPNYLKPTTLAGIIKGISQCVGVTANTEWALESTSRLLTSDHLNHLKDMGFTRLHVGVQTLDDETRMLIGRRETSRDVMAKVDDALKKGFIVSADIIYGLPGETYQQPLSALENLTATGIHGLSLYQLQRTKKNKTFLKRIESEKSDPLMNYVSFMAAEQFLRRKRYVKNFFTHYALPLDQSLYYRHALRGEDLLGIGPTADGVFGNYLYRHPNLKAYINSPSPGLQGGMLETVREQRIRRATVELMAATINYIVLKDLDELPLLEQWLACGFLEPAGQDLDFELTSNGSWFITNMIEQLRSRVNDHTAEMTDSEIVQRW